MALTSPIDETTKGLKYLSLFSGVGGFELGINKAYQGLADNRQTDIRLSVGQKAVNGAGTHIPLPKRHNGQPEHSTYPECIGYSEIDKYAVQTYQKHFKEHKNYGDVTTINETELPDFDLLVGGFPCQAFSVAGKRKGFDDTRGTLFFDIARIIKHKRPRHLVLENVQGLLSHDSGKTFQTILGVLADLGYGVEWQVLNGKRWVPQNRVRVIIIGHLRERCTRKVLPFTTTERDYSKPNKVFGILDSPTWQKRHEQIRRVHKTDGISPTLPNTQDKHGVYDGVRIRRLTPLECERLMGWPDNWTEGVSDTQRYKQCGNGIIAPMVAAVIKRMELCL